jgi:hypothetical protein
MSTKEYRQEKREARDDINDLMEELKELKDEFEIEVGTKEILGRQEID